MVVTEPAQEVLSEDGLLSSPPLLFPHKTDTSSSRAIQNHLRSHFFQDSISRMWSQYNYTIGTPVYPHWYLVSS